MADQPLKDWVRKQDLRFSGDWPNSNENLEVTNGGGTWLRNYAPARVVLVDSGITETISTISSLARFRIARESCDLADSREDEEKLHSDTDTGRGEAELVSLYGPTRADDSSALREPLAAIKNEKSENTPSSLESLRRTVLELKNSLTMSDRNGNIIFPRSGIIIISISYTEKRCY